MTGSTKRRLFAAGVVLVSALGVFAIVLALRHAGRMQRLDFVVYDILVRGRPKAPTPPAPILIVGYDESDIQAISHPISDSKLVELLERLYDCNPTAIGVDIFRDLEIRRADEDAGGRRRLDEFLAAEENWNLVFITAVDREKGTVVPPPPILRSPEFAGRIGFHDHALDDDGLIRRALISMKDQLGQEHVSLGLWLALYHLYAAHGIEHARTPSGELQLGKALFRQIHPTTGDYARADARGEQFLLDFRGPRRFRMVSVMDVLERRVRPEEIEGKVVLIGMTADSVPDYLATPIDVPPRPRRFGVEVHALLVDQLLRGALYGHEPTTTLSDRAEALWILLWSAVGACTGFFVRRMLPFALAGMAGVAVLALVVWAAFNRNLWLPSVEPAIGFTIAAALVAPAISSRERSARKMVTDLFAGFTSKQVAGTITTALLDGRKFTSEKLTATVLFTDLKGFTSITERMPPDVLIDWLNRYLTRMSEVIQGHGGFVNKFIGDGIMAVFGVPLRRETEEQVRADAVAAVACAIDIRAELAKINAEFAGRLPGMCIRVGILTGELTAGILGKAKLEYTVIGDTVNAASRLESFNGGGDADLEASLWASDVAADNCRILIGEETLKRVGEQFATRFICEVAVKGKRQKIAIHGVVGKLAHADPDGTKDVTQCVMR